MVGNPGIADAGAIEGDGGAAGAIERRVILIEAGRIEHRQADREETVGRDDGADIVAEAEIVDGRPDLPPLVLLSLLAADDEIGKRAEGEEILARQRIGADEIEGVDVALQLPEPCADRFEVRMA